MDTPARQIVLSELGKEDRDRLFDLLLENSLEFTAKDLGFAAKLPTASPSLRNRRTSSKARLSCSPSPAVAARRSKSEQRIRNRASTPGPRESPQAESDKGALGETWQQTAEDYSTRRSTAKVTRGLALPQHSPEGRARRRSTSRDIRGSALAQQSPEEAAKRRSTAKDTCGWASIQHSPEEYATRSSTAKDPRGSVSMLQSPEESAARRSTPKDLRGSVSTLQSPEEYGARRLTPRESRASALMQHSPEEYATRRSAAKDIQEAALVQLSLKFPKFAAKLAPAKVAIKALHQASCFRMMDEIYDKRFVQQLTYELACEEDPGDDAGTTPRSPLPKRPANFPDFVFDAMTGFYGLKHLTMQSCWAFLAALEKLRSDHDSAKLFTMFLNEDFDCDSDLVFFLQARQVIFQTSKHPWSSISRMQEETPRTKRFLIDLHLDAKKCIKMVRAMTRDESYVVLREAILKKLDGLMAEIPSGDKAVKADVLLYVATACYHEMRGGDEVQDGATPTPLVLRHMGDDVLDTPRTDITPASCDSRQTDRQEADQPKTRARRSKSTPTPSDRQLKSELDHLRGTLQEEFESGRRNTDYRASIVEIGQTLSQLSCQGPNRQRTPWPPEETPASDSVLVAGQDDHNIELPTQQPLVADSDFAADEDDQRTAWPAQPPPMAELSPSSFHANLEGNVRQLLTKAAKEVVADVVGSAETPDENMENTLLEDVTPLADALMETLVKDDYVGWLGHLGLRYPGGKQQEAHFNSLREELTQALNDVDAGNVYNISKAVVSTKEFGDVVRRRAEDLGFELAETSEASPPGPQCSGRRPNYFTLESARTLASSPQASRSSCKRPDFFTYDCVRTPAASPPGAQDTGRSPDFFAYDFARTLHVKFESAADAWACFDYNTTGSPSKNTFLSCARRLGFRGNDLLSFVGVDADHVGGVMFADFEKLWQLGATVPKDCDLVPSFGMFLQTRFMDFPSAWRDLDPTGVGELPKSAFVSFTARLGFDGNAERLFKLIDEGTGLLTLGRLKKVWDMAARMEVMIDFGLHLRKTHATCAEAFEAFDVHGAGEVSKTDFMKSLAGHPLRRGNSTQLYLLMEDGHGFVNKKAFEQAWEVSQVLWDARCSDPRRTPPRSSQASRNRSSSRSSLHSSNRASTRASVEGKPHSAQEES